MNRLLISSTIIIYSQNNQISINLTRVFLTPEIDFIISENDSFYFNDYPKFLAKEKQYQDTDSNVTLGTLEILVKLIIKPHLLAIMIN